ncbi:MAG: hypothetical protein SGJ18_14210 [Pseudomonadota bacterium]|nr:hypothetical protein [Pseudomonadota bacterium]
MVGVPGLKLKQSRLMTMALSILILIGTGCAKTALPGPDSSVSEQLSLGEEKIFTQKQGATRIVSQADAQETAMLIFSRLAGYRPLFNDPKIVDMVAKLMAGQSIAAAKVATDDPAFCNKTLRLVATKMSYRDENPTNPSNDFVATFVGAICKEDIDARKLLTDNFYFQFDQAQLLTVPAAPAINRTNLTIAADADRLTKILKSNLHYETMDVIPGGFDYRNLVRGPSGILIRGPNDTVSLLPAEDASALISSRGFMSAHAIAGTNRRLYEFINREFNCIAMEDFADTSRSDEFVARDVNKYDDKYNSQCKGCHTQMDAMKSAFAYFDFFDGGVGQQYTKHSGVYLGVNQVRLAPATAENANQFKSSNNVPLDPINVSWKLNRNADFYGKSVIDNRWTNNIMGTTNRAYFGWNGAMTGKGVQALGVMISSSERFPKCIAERAFTEVCKRKPGAADRPMIDWVAQQMKQNNYSVKTAYQSVATQIECIGE